MSLKWNSLGESAQMGDWEFIITPASIQLRTSTQRSSELSNEPVNENFNMGEFLAFAEFIGEAKLRVLSLIAKGVI